MELPEKDQPDESIWNHPELLEEWFEQVKLRRENPGKEIIPKEDESDWMQNELTLELKKGK